MYYIYAYLRDDGTPYYIGKGKGKRAFFKEHSVNIPKDKTRIVIMESNLTELGALALERFYIRWYGRKDIGTGILRNLTDGGEGASGRICSEEVKQKIGAANKNNKSRYGIRHSEETRKKISDAHKGKKLTEEQKKKIGKNSSEKLSGRTLSEDHKNKICKSNTGKKRSQEFREYRKQAMLGIKRGPYKKKLQEQN